MPVRQFKARQLCAVSLFSSDSVHVVRTRVVSVLQPDDYEITDAQVALGRAKLVEYCEATDDPLVSIIIPTYNNEEQIEAAVQSALDQTLKHVEVIVVDDCSTDSTAAVLQRIAAEDPRLIVSSTPENSGGVGAPRNVGMKLARGEYVTFLDGDDTITRHAAKAMASMALATGADLTMAQTKRRDVRNGRLSPWHQRLFSKQIHVSSIEDHPDLVIDTIAVAKLYQTDFLRANKFDFPVGVNYEDLIYTTRVFSTANGISVTPEVVYYWNVYPTEVRTTITQQRDSTANLEHRINAIETLLRETADVGVPNMRRRIFVKLIRHDFKVYLNDIAEGRALPIAEDTLKLMQPLVEAVPEDVFEEADVPQRLLYGAVLAGQPDLVPNAVYMTWGQAEMLGEVTVEGSAARWEGNAIDASGSELAKELTTFDPNNYTDVPWVSDKWFIEVLEVSKHSASQLKVDALIHDPFNKLAGLPDFEVALTLNERTGQKRRWFTPVDITEVNDGSVKFSALIGLPDPVDSARTPRITIRANLMSQAARIEAPLRLRPGQKPRRKSITGASGLSRAISRYYRPYSTNQRTLALRPVAVSKKRKPFAKALTVAAKPVLGWSGQMIKYRQTATDSIDKLVYAGYRKLPLNPNRVLVEVNMGRTDGESPGAVAAAMKALNPKLEVVYAAEAGAWWRLKHENTVTRGSYDYLKELATAKYIIDNQTLPAYFVKKPGQVYVQTWHGIPLKKMGLDKSEMKMASLEEHQKFAARNANWDYITVPSEYFARTFIPAFGVQATQLPMGTPRNDELVQAGESQYRKARASLGVPAGATAILYAPTFRRDFTGATLPVGIDFDLWDELLPEDAIVMVRAHYLAKASIPKRLAHRFVDVSSVKDTNLPMIASDMLVTDFSSIMFDYLSLDRPIIIFADDYDHYMNDARGTYFDLKENPPGPVTESVEALMQAVAEAADNDDHRALRHDFRDAFAGIEPGDAAEQTARIVLGRES